MEKIKTGSMVRQATKSILFGVLLIIPFVALINIKGAFSQDNTTTDETHISSPLKMQGEINALQDKVGKLEKTVADQAALIEQQKKVLDKLLEFAPSEVKAAAAPPEPKTLVKKFVVDGANLFTAKDFESVLNKYKDKELSMTDLKRAADEITGLYRKKGYIVTLAYLPTQEITDNTVEFKVVEGRVGDIQVEKPKYGKVEAIQKKILIEKGQILDSKQLEVNLHRINKQPDRTMRAVLSPGATPETTDILFKLDKERSPQHFYGEFNNRGSKYTNKNRWGLGYVNNNLLGNDDILSLRFTANQKTEVYSGSVAYDLPISRYNTRLGGYAAYSKADIGGQFAILTPEGRAHVWGIYVSHPWLDKEFYDEATNTSLSLTSNLTAGFDSLSVYNKIMKVETSHDEIRAFKGGINFEENDSMGRGGLTVEVQAGIPDFLGSMSVHDASASRIDAGGKFQKYLGSITRITRLPVSSMLINSFKFQYTTYPLVNSEQMIIGGADTVRGFPEAEYLADYGWINTVELRTPMFFLPAVLKVPFDKKHTSLVDAIQLVGFLDAGKGYLNEPRVGETPNRYLIGAGFGFRFDLYEHFRGRIDVGFPIGNEKPSDGSNSTVHFGLQYEW
ncbi:MAG: ShlB/FhaC/HecB family hemolysin secretion/activation protein [Candidatus Omnitrophota bacterium]